MSDRQLAKELQARNILAERIATVLRQRQEVGVERRTHECEYQRLNNDRALARYYRLSGGVPQAVRDGHVKNVVERAVQPFAAHFRWNSVNGSTV